MANPPPGFKFPPEVLAVLKKKLIRVPTLKKVVLPWEMLPRGYGVAYLDPVAPRVIAYPVPLNLLIVFARHLWFAVAHIRPGKFEKMLQAEYERGYRDGRASRYKSF